MFQGTIISEVDAYGTLTVNGGSGITSFSGAVTRLKTIQNLDLSIGNGNLILTSYHYYDDSNGNLVFKSSRIDVTSTLNDPLTATVNESYVDNTLKVFGNEVSNLTLSIFPNPVKNHLIFKLNNNAVINSITVSDISGRQVLMTKTNVERLSVNQLSRGLYIASITTNKGTFSQKFIKE